MTQPPVLDTLGHIGMLPVVVIDHPDHARPLADALSAAGLRCVEITLRTPAAEAAIRSIADDNDLLVGAGTVLEPGQVGRCAAAGARFVVSPGFDPDVFAACQRLGLPVLPGIATATELQRARRAGLGAVKFFPAQACGGLTMLRALAAPFRDMQFVPTGGIGPDNAAPYLRHPAVLAVGGSWMTPPQLIAQGRWDLITQLARDAARLVASCRTPASA